MSQKKVEEAAKLLFLAIRYYITNPHLASRIVVMYFGVFDLKYKMVVLALKNAPRRTKSMDYLYELYKKYWL